MISNSAKQDSSNESTKRCAIIHRAGKLQLINEGRIIKKCLVRLKITSPHGATTCIQCRSRYSKQSRPSLPRWEGPTGNEKFNSASRNALQQLRDDHSS